MTIPTYEITAELRAELRDAVTWWQDHGRPHLTEAHAIREALEDWLAALRAEHFADAEVPMSPAPRVLGAS